MNAPNVHRMYIPPLLMLHVCTPRCALCPLGAIAMLDRYASGILYASAHAPPQSVKVDKTTSTLSLIATPHHQQPPANPSCPQSGLTLETRICAVDQAASDPPVVRHITPL